MSVSEDVDFEAESGPAEHRDLVVVGVDGSEPSDAALRCAAKEARLRKAVLKVVHAWHVPSTGYGGYMIPVGTLDDFASDAAKATDEQVSAVLGDNPGIELITEIREGPASRAILDAAKDAELIVVGSRGRGGFSGLLLGSVSSQVAHHAHCPVLIVRPGTQAR